MENLLTPWVIRNAYEQGAFPMADDDDEIQWYRPHVRALLPLTGVHVSHSLQKTIRQRKFEIRFDTVFSKVIEGCLRPGDNWINPEIMRVYAEIHHQGWGHCVECWQNGELVGGLYGLALGSCFCGESMFHRETDASKIALWAMVEKCRELGFTVFDAQVMNPHLARMGAYEIPHREYMKLLKLALKNQTPWSGIAPE